MTVALGVAAGLAFGLTPFGGGLLAVPLLMAGLHLEPRAAVAAACAILALNGAVGAGDGARARALETGPALWAAGGGLIGAPLGVAGLLALPAMLWAVGYCLVGAVGAWLLWRTSEGRGIGVRAGLLLGGPRLPAGRMPATSELGSGLRLAAAGVAGGALGGLFGGGPGLLLVPALGQWAGLDRRQAQAGALFAAVAVGAAGAGALWLSGQAADWHATGLLVLSAVAGFGFARRLSSRLPSVWWLRAMSLLLLAGSAFVALSAIAAGYAPGVPLGF